MVATRLRLRRQALALSVTAVAARTHISIRMIEAIETGDFAAFRGRVFALGCVRSYAQMLGIATDELLDAFESETRFTWTPEDIVVAPKRLRKPGPYWGRHGQISMFF